MSILQPINSTYSSSACTTHQSEENCIREKNKLKLVIQKCSLPCVKEKGSSLVFVVCVKKEVVACCDTSISCVSCVIKTMYVFILLHLFYTTSINIFTVFKNYKYLVHVHSCFQQIHKEYMR